MILSVSACYHQGTDANGLVELASKLCCIFTCACAYMLEWQQILNVSSTHVRQSSASMVILQMMP